MRNGERGDVDIYDGAWSYFFCEGKRLLSCASESIDRDGTEDVCYIKTI